MDSINREAIAREVAANSLEAMEERANVHQLETCIAKATTEAAFAQFPVLKNMSAEQIIEFGRMVKGLSRDFSRRAADFAFLAENVEE